MTEPKATIPPGTIYSFASQRRQYPPTGIPGISYFRGQVDARTYVDCLLYRDQHGRLTGILNHYPFRMGPADHPLEEVGNVNIWVHPDFQRRGIATALWREAVRRWDVSLDQQRFTIAGAAFARYLQKNWLASGPKEDE